MIKGSFSNLIVCFDYRLSILNLSNYIEALTKTFLIFSVINFISSNVKVGWQRNMIVLSPINLELVDSFFGAKDEPRNAFSLYISEQDPEKQGTPSLFISFTILFLDQFLFRFFLSTKQ